MKQTYILIVALIVVAGIGYWLLSDRSTETPPAPPVTDPAATSDEPAVDEAADASAEPAGDPGGDYVGRTESEAAALATERGVPFRVVERDGEMRPMTRDYRPGRINAVVEDGEVVSYTVEGQDMDKGGEAAEPATEPADAAGGVHDDIIGMSVAQAEAYASTEGVPFRIGSVDGEPRPVTMDYRPGRITASIRDGIVTSYTVE